MTRTDDSGEFQVIRAATFVSTVSYWLARIAIPFAALLLVAGLLYFARSVEHASLLLAQAKYSNQFGKLFGHNEQHLSKTATPAEVTSSPKYRDTLGTLTSRLASGGFTFDPQREESSQLGYALSIYPQYGRVFETIDQVTPAEIFQYIIDTKSVWSNTPNVHVGGWYNQKTPHRPDGNNKVYLDLIVIVETERQAMELGRQYGQLAAFNLDAGTTVPIMTEEEQLQWEAENHAGRAASAP
jgi:hypothetical protein